MSRVPQDPPERNLERQDSAGAGVPGAEPEPVWDYVSAEAVTRLYETVARMPGTSFGRPGGAARAEPVPAPISAEGSLLALTLRFDEAQGRVRIAGRPGAAEAEPAPHTIRAEAAGDAARLARIETVLSGLAKRLFEVRAPRPRDPGLERRGDTTEAGDNERSRASVSSALEDIADRMHDLCSSVERMIEEHRRERDELTAAMKSVQGAIAALAGRQTESGAEARSVSSPAKPAALQSMPIFRGRTDALTAAGGAASAWGLPGSTALDGAAVDGASAGTDYSGAEVGGEPASPIDETARGPWAGAALAGGGRPRSARGLAERVHVAALAILAGVTCFIAAAQVTAGTQKRDCHAADGPRAAAPAGLSGWLCF